MLRLQHFNHKMSHKEPTH